MRNTALNIDNMHWILQILQNIEVGLVVFDRQYKVEVWNGFMENHSGISSGVARGENLFSLLPTLPKNWFEYKTDSVLKLGIQAHCNWQQEPHSLCFENTRPFTARSEFMFQNITLFPLFSSDKTIERVCALIYDVSEEANSLLQLQSISRTDSLSQLLNRGYWQELFEQEFARCRRYGDQASVILVDIDNFKTVNDTYGHQVGDKAIQQIAHLIQENQRETDSCGRYGGEEFVITLPKTSVEDAHAVAERLRQQVENSPLIVDLDGKREPIDLTISLGVAELLSSMTSADDWLKQADSALYHAKQQGRNRVVIANT
ncbi:MAG: GGDEF domain-containing protein [Pseudomonadota bacterium]